jgi:ribose transport system substrate-binding protein
MAVTRRTFLSSLTLLIGMAGGAYSADAPAWLPGKLSKPLSDITIGFANVNAGGNAYSATYTDTFIATAKELGVKAVVLDAQADAAKQADQIRDLIAQQVDVLVVWPVNGKAVVPAVKSASEANIPVVITNSKIDDSGKKYTKTFSGPNDYAEAQMAAELMIKALSGKGNVVIIGGTPGYTVSQLREQGFRDAIGKHPDIKVLDSQPVNWSREKSQALMEDYITRFGKTIDGVYAMDSGMGIGALSAIQAAEKEGKLERGHIKQTDATLFGVVYDAIKANEYYGSVLQSPEEDAKAALKAAILLVEGQTLPQEVYFDGVAVTKENVEQIKRPSF